MKIAIDMSQIVYGTGVSHYRINLVKNLLEIDKKNEYVLFAGALKRRKEILATFPQTKVFPFPPKLADFIWNRLHILPIEKLIGDVGIIHTSDWVEPPSKIRKVTTIHDIIPLKFPRLMADLVVNTHKRRLKWVKEESEQIIAPSINTKKDLIDFGFSEDKIKVIYEAPNLTSASEGRISIVKRKFRIFDNYLIAIGTAKRKNIDRIISAYHLSKFGKDLKLVIVGENSGIRKTDRGVIFTGFVSDYDLEALLSGATALVFASLYEGLGIPVLDAFNCHVPVVASNISSIPEFAGDAAILVDPYDVSSISDGIEKAVSSPKSLIAKGIKQVKKFSWETTAKETLNVYEGVMA